MISCGSIYGNRKCDISIMPMRSDTLSAVFPPDCVGDHSISASVPKAYTNGHKVENAHHTNQNRYRWIHSNLHIILIESKVCSYIGWLWVIIKCALCIKWYGNKTSPLSTQAKLLTSFKYLEGNETNLRQHKCQEQDSAHYLLNKTSQDLKLTFRNPLCRSKFR